MLAVVSISLDEEFTVEREIKVKRCFDTSVLACAWNYVIIALVHHHRTLCVI